MSDNPTNGNGAAGANPEATVPAAQIQVLAQYVKDLSFENPAAPMSLQGAKPALEVGVDVQARGLGVDQYEVTIRVRADAKPKWKPVAAASKKLSEIPADQPNTTMAWGAQFASRLLVHCP